MKKIVLMLASSVLVAGMLTFSSCGDADVTKPVITLKGNNPDRVELFSATSYTDPGATVADDNDKNLDITVDGTVDMNNAGDYTLTYSSTDKAGNIAKVERTVTVDGALYLDGSYDVADNVNGSITNYVESITSSTINFNKIYFSRFGNYDDGTVYATVSGKTITIPSQIVQCGTSPNIASRNFTGSGTFVSHNTFTINYTELTNGTTVTATGTYTLK
jgi:hypothetical protein